MSPEEALKICRLAKAASPAQAVDEYSPELWALVLASKRFVDARDAVVQLAAVQEWIHVSHVVARIRKIRSDRIVAFGTLPDPPPEIGIAEYPHWLAETRRRIADGKPVERTALPEPDPEHQQRMGELIRGAFREPEEA